MYQQSKTLIFQNIYVFFLIHCWKVKTWKKNQNYSSGSGSGIQKKIQLKNLVLTKGKDGKTKISTKVSPKPKVQPKTRLSAPPLIPVPPEVVYTGEKQKIKPKTKLSAPPLIPVPPEVVYSGSKHKTRPFTNQNGSTSKEIDLQKEQSINRYLPWQTDTLMDFYTHVTRYPTVEDKKKLAVQVIFVFLFLHIFRKMVIKTPTLCFAVHNVKKLNRLQEIRCSGRSF